MRCRKKIAQKRLAAVQELPADGNWSIADYASILRDARASGSLAEAKCVHNGLKHLFPRDIFLSNLVILMYADCGAPGDARLFFEEMHSHDIYSWNFMVKAYVKADDHHRALQLFEQMQQECSMPNKFVYVSILALFTNADDVANGKLIHARVACGDYSSDMILQTGLISMYSKCGRLRNARWLFDRMQEKDAASWNALVAGYAQQGLRKGALQLLGQMRSNGLLPNTATIVSVLSTCLNPSSLADGKWIHSQVKGTNLEADITVNNALIAMYGKCGSLEDANTVFIGMMSRNTITFLNILTAYARMASVVNAKRLQELIYESQLELGIAIENALISMFGKCGSVTEAQKVFDKMYKRNLISWNALLAGYAQNIEGERALQTLHQMLQEGVMPNNITFISCIDACAGLEDQDQGRRLHALVCNNSEFEIDVILGTALIHMYGKCKNSKDARDIFDRVADRDVPCWNAIITVYSQLDGSKVAFYLFHQMQEEGFLPDEITFISSFSGCTSEAALEHGVQLHSRIACFRLASNIVIGNALINMYGKCSSLKDALHFFSRMAERDYVTFVNVFSICASNAALLEGRQLHVGIMGSDMEENVVVGNSIINMYGKCGSLKHARLFFNCMAERNIVSWNAMLSVYAQTGLGHMALDLFHLMSSESEKPNAVTLVCILSACSHAGLIDEGHHYFCSMAQKLGIAPNADHYNCMIDMLTRAGRLDEAEELIKKMAYEPTVVTWTTLLGACRNQVDEERAVRVAQRVLQLDCRKSSAYITLLNIFKALGREDDAASIICMIRGSKEPSSSSVNEIPEMNEVSQLQHAC